MPVIVTAANSNYFDALQATVYQIHMFLPDFKLIIYDLGLSDEQIILVIFFPVIIIKRADSSVHLLLK